VSDKYEGYKEDTKPPNLSVAKRTVWKNTTSRRFYAATKVKRDVSTVQTNYYKKDAATAVERHEDRASVLFPISYDGHIDNEGYRIKNVADPVDDQDVATKYYIDFGAWLRGPTPGPGALWVYGSEGAGNEPNWFANVGPDGAVLVSVAGATDGLTWLAGAEQGHILAVDKDAAEGVAWEVPPLVLDGEGAADDGGAGISFDGGGA
jgi:hypothetical protein